MKTSEEQFNENLSGLAELIEDKELFEFYKSVIISMLDSKPKKFCTCSFCMIRRDEKTQIAYCFGCKKEIDED